MLALVSLALVATALVASPDPAGAAAPPRPIVYLTFDDGPSAHGGTAGILDVLARHDVTATFFVLGSYVEARPAMFSRILAEGHAVGTHSWDHTNYPQLSEAGIAWQLDRSIQAMRAAGGPPVTCHRAPYGNANATVRRVAQARGLAEIYWDIDPRDYTSSSSWIVSQLDQVRNGSVVLLHDGSSNWGATAAALETWLSANRDRYDFRALPACTGGPPGPRSVYRPTGAVDRVVADDGRIDVAGWTLDWDAPGRSNFVHVYVNDRFVTEVRAASRRPDVNSVTGASGDHGFGVTIGAAPGTYRVCVHGLGLDSAGRYDGRNAPLGGCRTVVVGDGAPPPTGPGPAQVPTGWVDLVAGGSGILEVAGWTFDPDAPGRSTFVHVYVDGAFWGEWRADRNRPDVNAVTGVSGRHGFVARGGVSPGPREVCVYALGIDGAGSLDGRNPLLGCRRITVG